MAKKKLTPLTMKNLKRGFHRDEMTPNLYVQVSKFGTLSYVFRYKSPITGKPRWLGLGGVDEIRMATARELATNAREQVKAGRAQDGPVSAGSASVRCYNCIWS